MTLVVVAALAPSPTGATDGVGVGLMEVQGCGDVHVVAFRLVEEDPSEDLWRIELAEQPLPACYDARVDLGVRGTGHPSTGFKGEIESGPWELGPGGTYHVDQLTLRLTALDDVHVDANPSVSVDPGNPFIVVVDPGTTVTTISLKYTMRGPAHGVLP